MSDYPIETQFRLGKGTPVTVNLDPGAIPRVGDYIEVCTSVETEVQINGTVAQVIWCYYTDGTALVQVLLAQTEI